MNDSDRAAIQEQARQDAATAAAKLPPGAPWWLIAAEIFEARTREAAA